MSDAHGHDSHAHDDAHAPPQEDPLLTPQWVPALGAVLLIVVLGVWIAWFKPFAGMGSSSNADGDAGAASADAAAH